MSDVTMKAKKDFQFGRGSAAPMIRAGQTFPCPRSTGAELAANGLAEVEGGEDLGKPERSYGSAMPRGTVLPPVHPTAFGDVTALPDDPLPPGQMAPTPLGEFAKIEGSDAPKPADAPQPAEAPEPAKVPADKPAQDAPQPAEKPAEGEDAPADRAARKRS